MIAIPTITPTLITDRLVGTLLGTALGDDLGLACERMSARAIARRFGQVDRFHLLGRTGIVSDDTEQAALVAQSLARHPDDVDFCVRAHDDYSAVKIREANHEVLLIPSVPASRPDNVWNCFGKYSPSIRLEPGNPRRRPSEALRVVPRGQIAQVRAQPFSRSPMGCAGGVYAEAVAANQPQQQGDLLVSQGSPAASRPGVCGRPRLPSDSIRPLALGSRRRDTRSIPA